MFARLQLVLFRLVGGKIQLNWASSLALISFPEAHEEEDVGEHYRARLASALRRFLQPLRVHVCIPEKRLRQERNALSLNSS